ncbi:hypothetical protein KAW65_00675 [candidate division WOR-3 bacterium]|nr:hypothetical protein [candidate division WOR-3 bacterium]
MAIYTNSVWGEIRGKVGEGVGYVQHGKKILRAYVAKKKIDRGTIYYFEKEKRGEVEKGTVSIKSIHIRYAIFAPLVYFAKENYENLILPAWNKICTKRKYKMMPQNLFMKYNARILYKSIPNKDKIFSPINMPDLTQLYLTEGDLEPANILNASYNRKNGKLTIKWDKKCFFNGHPEDNTYIFAIHWKMPEPNEQKPKLYKTMKYWGDAINPVAKRGDGEAHIFISKNLDPKYGVVFLFFKNEPSGYSPTTNKRFTNSV